MDYFFVYHFHYMDIKQMIMRYSRKDTFSVISGERSVFIVPTEFDYAVFFLPIIITIAFIFIQLKRTILSGMTLNI